MLKFPSLVGEKIADKWCPAESKIQRSSQMWENETTRNKAILEYELYIYVCVQQGK